MEEKKQDNLNIAGLIKKTKRFFIGLIGMTVLILGFLMVVLPGPAIIFIPLGLTILATEYLWARIWLKKLNSKVSEIKKKILKK